MIYLFEADHEFWNSRNIRAAVREALEGARRIEKEIDIARETARLGVALRTVERAIVARIAPKLVKGAEAESLIAALPRIGPVRLPFNLLDKAGTGAFVLAVPFTGFATVSTIAVADESRRLVETHPPIPSAMTKLHSRIAAARTGNRSVALGNSRHVELTKALRTFLHASEGEAPFKLNFIYKDGSAGGDVYLRQLPVREPPVGAVELTAALESCRHTDLDLVIDFYVLRNTEIGRREDATFADQEAIAYARSQTCLAELCGTDGLHLRLFHTGLEPAVIGVYRAIIDALRSGYRLRVTPVFFLGGEDEQDWW
jgi:hypothetical protein